MAGRAGEKGQNEPGLKRELRFFSFHRQFQQTLLLSRPPGYATQATWGPKELLTLQTDTQWIAEKIEVMMERELSKVTLLIVHSCFLMNEFVMQI